MKPTKLVKLYPFPLHLQIQTALKTATSRCCLMKQLAGDGSTVEI